MATKTKGKYKRRKRNFTLPIAVVGPLLAEGVKVGKAVAAGDTRKAMEYIVADYTGYNINSNDFDLTRLKNGLLPLMFGGGVHKLATKFGINRMLSGAGVPWLRI